MLWFSSNKEHTWMKSIKFDMCRGRCDQLHSQETSNNMFTDIKLWFNKVW